MNDNYQSGEFISNPHLDVDREGVEVHLADEGDLAGQRIHHNLVWVDPNSCRKLLDLAWQCLPHATAAIRSALLLSTHHILHWAVCTACDRRNPGRSVRQSKLWLRQDWLDYNIHIFQAICQSYKSYYMHLPILRESCAFQKTSGPWSPGQESKAWAECSHSPLPWWKACRPDWRSSPRLPGGRDWRWVCDPATSRWSRRRAWWRSLGPKPTALTGHQTSLSLNNLCIACTAMLCFVLWELF